jgi:hypothetical protein
MLLKLFPAGTRQSFRFCLRHLHSVKPSAAVPEHPPAVERNEETVAEELLKEAAKHLSGEEESNWESSMAVIRKTEQSVPQIKPTEEELLKIRKAGKSRQ